MTIAVLDTGINRSSPEFAGRISADSTGFEQKVARCGTCVPETLAPFPIDDRVGHGTEVASIALAARNGSGPQGVAPDATLLALKVVGPDLTGVSALSTTPIPESAGANVALIGPALRYAVEKGAFVSVLSINGGASGQAATDMRAGIDAVRQADRLVVNSVSNATGEDSFTGQFGETLVGNGRANKEWFLFAIGLDQNGVPRAQNGNAGPLADRMLAAAGNSVSVIDKDGNVATVTGNSFAAPAVAGAAALLKQYWPQLGGKAISRILLDTATDAGTPGVDAVYGAGILNVDKAMQAQAPASAFVAADTVLARFSSLTLSAPFGGAATAAALGERVSSMTILDRYGRDYGMMGTSGIRVRNSGLLAGAMLGAGQPVGSASTSDRTRFGLTSTPVGPWQGVTSSAPAYVSFSSAPGQTVTFGANVAIGQGRALTASPLRAIGLNPIGVSSAWSGHGWSASFASGAARDRRGKLQMMSFSTPFGVGLEVTGWTERGQALGLTGAASLGIRGAQTRMATLTARQTVAGVALTVRATASTTRVRGGSDLLRFDRSLLGTAFAVEGAHALLGGVATLGVSSPLRLQRASAIVLAPVSYDLISGVLTTRSIAVDLTPHAREVDLEAGWGAALSPTSSVRVGVARAFDAGHVAGATATAGYLTLVLR